MRWPAGEALPPARRSPFSKSNVMPGIMRVFGRPVAWLAGEKGPTVPAVAVPEERTNTATVHAPARHRHLEVSFVCFHILGSKNVGGPSKRERSPIIIVGPGAA